MPFYLGGSMSNIFLYIFAIAIVMIAQSAVQNAYQKYRRIKNTKGLTGAAVARSILDANGMQNVKIEVSNRGILSDYFDPIHQVVCLSNDIYYNTSIASISVAAHECGHAIQHKERYFFIDIRNKLLPFANIATQIGWFVVMLGLLLFSQMNFLFYTGVIMLLIVAVFQLVTLPLEFDASSRGIRQLSDGGFIIAEEEPYVKAMLKAAAFTYIASLVATLANILRIVLIARSRDD